MEGRSGGERIDRLDQVVQVIADGQWSLQTLIAELATETRRGFDRVAQQFEETDRRMRQTDHRIRQTDERMRQTDEGVRQTDEGMRQIDERIDKLVIAIRELIRHPIIPPA